MFRCLKAKPTSNILKSVQREPIGSYPHTGHRACSEHWGKYECLILYSYNSRTRFLAWTTGALYTSNWKTWQIGCPFASLALIQTEEEWKWGSTAKQCFLKDYFFSRSEREPRSPIHIQVRFTFGSLRWDLGFKGLDVFTQKDRPRILSGRETHFDWQCFVTVSLCI